MGAAIGLVACAGVVVTDMGGADFFSALTEPGAPEGLGTGGGTVDWDGAKGIAEGVFGCGMVGDGCENK